MGITGVKMGLNIKGVWRRAAGGGLRKMTRAGGGEVANGSNGGVGPEELVSSAERANAWKTWGLRLLGFIFMIVGSMLIVSPVQEVVSYLRWIPLVGGFAAGVVNLGISY